MQSPVGNSRIFEVMDSQLASKFLEYLALEKRMSAHTIINYKKDLHDFHSFLVMEYVSPKVSTATRKDVRNFVIHQRKAGQSARTVNRKISCLRSFFKFLIKIGEISFSPMDGIQQLPADKKVVVPISEDEIHNIPKMLDDIKESFHPYQELFMVELLYQTGMRRQELIDLAWRDVDLPSKTIRVMGKGNKQRIIPIGEGLVRALQNLRVHRDRPSCDEGNVFVTKKGKAFYAKLVYLAVNSYLSSVSAKEKLSPHVLRHSFATHLLSKGAEVNSIKELLGHSSLASTQVYLHNDIENLKQVFNQAHPRGAIKNKKTR